MGDYCEFVNYSDKRFSPDTLSDWLEMKDLEKLAKVEADWIIEKLKPIADRCIGLHCGNHEESIRIKYHQNVHDYMCLALGVKNLGWSALTNLFFRSDNKHTYLLKLASEHGNFGGYYVGGAINRAVMRTGEKDADIFASGHCHKKLGTPEVMIGSTNNENPEPKEIPKVVIITGTYFRTCHKGTTVYSEKKAYRPTALGSPYLDIWMERYQSEGKEKQQIRMALTLET